MGYTFISDEDLGNARNQPLSSNFITRNVQQKTINPALDKELAKRRGLKSMQQKQLDEFDANSGKFFDQMRTGFRQRSQAVASSQLTGGLSALNQAGARAGTSFSGVNQAQTGNLYGQIGAAQTEAQAGYDQRLNEMRQQARDNVQLQQLGFFNEIQKMNYSQDLEKELMTFQAELADKYNSGWNDFFSVVGKGIGMFAGGGFGSLSSIFGGGPSSGNAHSYRMSG